MSELTFLIWTSRLFALPQLLEQLLQILVLHSLLTVLLLKSFKVLLKDFVFSFQLLIFSYKVLRDDFRDFTWRCVYFTSEAVIR